MPQLNTGDSFPPLKGSSLEHGEISLPGAIPEGNYGVILAYRAEW